MNIVYIHGFASSVKDSDPKYDALAAIGTVHPIAPDYTQPQPNVMTLVEDFCLALGNVGLVIGTSMGGYTASFIGNKLNIPFISLNPSIKPSSSLAKYQNDYPTLKEVLSTYPNFDTSNSRILGKVFVNLGDDVINPNDTLAFMKTHGIEAVALECGGHRFSNIEEVIEDVKIFVHLTHFCLETPKG